METELYILNFCCTIINLSSINGLILSLLLAIFLLVIASIVSGCEIAFFSLSPTEIEALKNEETKKSKQIIKNIEDPDNFLATIVLFKVLSNSILVIGLTLLTLNWFEARFITFFAEFLIITFFIVFFQENLFYSFAAKNAMYYTKLMIYPIYLLEIILHPLHSLLIFTDNVLNIKIIQNKYKISLDELSEIIDLNSVSPKDRTIIKGVTKFGDTDVKEVMKSRVDVTAIEFSSDFKEVKKIVIDSGYSRYPVYTDTFDTINGVLYIKDILPHLQSDSFEWQKIIRTPFFVPETKKINDLLLDFQRNKNHMAIINDEYGGTSGIVTLEDIVEEIVGDISDESDVEENLFTKIDDKNYLFEGKILLNDFYRITEIEDETFDEVKGDAETLAGLILNIKGEMPQKGDIVNFKFFSFRIELVDKRRIKQIRLTIYLGEIEEHGNEKQK